MNTRDRYRVPDRYLETYQVIPVTIDLSQRTNITDKAQIRGTAIDCSGSSLPLSTTKGQEVSVLSVYERWGQRSKDMRIFYIQGLNDGDVNAGTEIDQTGDIIIRDSKEYRVKGVEYWGGTGVTQAIGVHF